MEYIQKLANLYEYFQATFGTLSIYFYANTSVLLLVTEYSSTLVLLSISPSD